MDTNVVIGISVGSVTVCVLVCACVVGEFFARKRREKERHEFCAAANSVEGEVLVSDI